MNAETPIDREIGRQSEARERAQRLCALKQHAAFAEYVEALLSDFAIEAQLCITETDERLLRMAQGRAQKLQQILTEMIGADDVFTKTSVAISNLVRREKRTHRPGALGARS